MNDAELLALAVEHRNTKAKGKAILGKADKLQEQLLAEIRRRKSQVLTSKGNLIPGFAARGVKIMRLAQSSTDYSLEVAKARLKPATFRKLIRPVITKESMDEALAAGIITVGDVEAIGIKNEGGEWVATFGTLDVA